MKLLLLANLVTYVTAIRIMGILLGSDKDEWGCIPTAGYVWCNETDSCIPINEVCSNFIA